MKIATDRQHCIHAWSVFVATGIGLVLTQSTGAAEVRSAQPRVGPAATLEEIVVTARRRAEGLQRVPDAVTAFSADRIEELDIRSLADYVVHTPNLYAREGFRSGLLFVTIRGITTGQQGWSPITYTVDGVKAGAVDVINLAALFDVERIEVLRGPQSALYGAGAIAGAVNIVTKTPTDEFGGQVDATYAKGNDLTVRGAVSAPVVADQLAFRLTGYYRNADGLIDSSTGDDIDFVDQSWVKGRLTFTPSDAVSLDVRAAYNDTNAGAVKAQRFARPDQMNTFDDSIQVRRGIIGEENRTFLDLSAKLDVVLPFATLTSITSYGEVEQDVFGTGSWDRPPALGEPPLAGIFGPIFGANAGPGQAVDHYQFIVDDYDFLTEDLRLTSSGEGRVRWVVGAEYMQRDTINRLGVGIVFGPAPGTPVPVIVNRVDDKEDEILGGYGQVSVDLSRSLELTVAGRYDTDEYNTRRRDPLTGATIAQLDSSGRPVDLLEAKDSKFQPKVQLAYRWSEPFMTYVSYSEGYRFGFFSSGNLAKPESTKNYELGFKTRLPALMLNGAIFHIDYSNQQTTIPALPVFLVANVPSRDIYGVELEMDWLATEQIQITAGVGAMDAGQRGRDLLNAPRAIPPESVPELTTNLGLQFTQPVFESWDLMARADWYYQDKFQRPIRGALVDINSVHLVDLQLGVKSASWGVRAFVKNVLDEQYATGVFDVGAFLGREYNKPRSYGLELSYRF